MNNAHCHVPKPSEKTSQIRRGYFVTPKGDYIGNVMLNKYVCVCVCQASAYVWSYSVEHGTRPAHWTLHLSGWLCIILMICPPQKKKPHPLLSLGKLSVDSL